jgi:hypothetical protein
MVSLSTTTTQLETMMVDQQETRCSFASLEQVCNSNYGNCQDKEPGNEPNQSMIIAQ